MPSQTGSIDLTAQVSANNNAKDYSDNVVDNLVVGGRNLFVSGSASNGYPTDAAVGNAYGVSNMSANHEAYEKIPVEEESSYIVQYWVDDSAHAGWVCIQLLDSSDVIKNKICRTYPAADYWTTTIDIPTGVSQMLVSGRHLASGYAYAKIKVEKGNKATDWTPAPEDQEALVTSTRTWYATCDTAAATVAKVATTTDSGFTLHDGVVVDVKFANTNSGAVGSLTLNVNDTGAKSIKTMYNNSLANLTTAGQLYAGLVVRFVYSGTYWIAATNYNSDTYGRTRWQNVIRAIATANSITSGHIICGTESGYRDVAAGVAFDLSYPLLYAGTTISAASGTTDNTYLCINGPNITANGTVQSATQYKTVYLKGSLSGNTFTIAASNFLTCVVPTSADGYVYIPLGMFYNSTTNIYFNSSKELWAYVDGAFGPVSVREASAAAKTATNYITADANGISIHMAGNSTTYQRQTSDSTTFYVGGKKRSAVGADGLKVYVGINETEMASFGTSTRIGKAYVEGATDNESHLELDYRSMRMVDKDGNEFFEVEDLRETNGVANIVDIFVATSTRIYTLSFPAENTNYTVTVSDSSGGTVTKTATTIAFSAIPTANETITVEYTTTSSKAKAYTFGTRASGANTGAFSYAEGYDVVADGVFSHAEGQQTHAGSFAAHSEGYSTQAINENSHAEGDRTKASGVTSHVEGRETWATAPRSHAEGYKAIASGENSHAEGNSTQATAQSAHAEGRASKATYDESHAQNLGTIAAKKAQTAIGTFNVEDTSNTTMHPFNDPIIGQYALIIGNGTGSGPGTEQVVRSNAATIDWMGNYIGQAMAGIIQMFAGATPPTGWLVCDGSAISRTTYATLFAAIGTTWGAGDGSTTFNIPDLRGRTPIGAGTGSGLTARTLGDNLGAETHDHGGNSGEVTLSAAQSGLPAHTHAFTQPTVKVKYSKSVASGNAANHIDGSSSSSTAAPMDVSGGAVGAVTGGAKAATSAHKHTISSNANIPPAAVVNFIICTGKTS